MKLNAYRLTLTASLLTLLCAAGCSRELPQVDIGLNGQGAMICDARSGRVLFEKNADERFPPASTTKVMTAIVALEKLRPDSAVTPSSAVIQVEPTIAGLKPGVSYRLGDLISAILIKSANDAAVAIAEAVAGSETDFAEMMNEKARRIGMENTYFATASGLPTGKKDSQYTTARDLARMMVYASRNKVKLEAMSKKSEEIFGSDDRLIFLKTHNKTLIWDGADAPWGKTGYTREAKRTFAGVDPSTSPSIAFSLLKSDALWDDIRTLKNKGLELYEYSKRNFLADLIDWIAYQRSRGHRETSYLGAMS